MSSVSLLEAFPSPPTHIPNPPPSLPPTLPLPPVPGPSPISGNILRRSIASHRDSIASTAGEDGFLFPRASISPFPLSDIDDDDDDDGTDTPASYNESISDIQLPVTEEDEEDSVHTTTNASNKSMADLVDPLTFHLHIRAARARDESHNHSPRAHTESLSRVPRDSRGDFPYPGHPETDKQAIPDPRSVSPDIPTILSKTPRPRKQRSFVFSETTNANTSSTARPVPRRVSDGDIAIECSRRRVKNDVCSFASDQGVTFPSPGLIQSKILERSLEGDDSDSDSSIDLHTPLPRLMVRDGLLSPRSKLFSQPDRTSYDLRGSVYSIASNASAKTKSGIMRDERDTPMRRHRHRDGRMLRGGIGLTTGLGWSDSEDDDAPSPLTRRLSSLNLSRRSSASSVRSAHTHLLSRSLPEESEGDDTYDEHVRPRSNTLSTGTRYSAKPPHPPTSWQRRTQNHSRQSSISAGSKDSDSILQDTLNTPSTASSRSPSTPSDEPMALKSISAVANKNKTLPPLPSQPLRKIPSNISLTGARPGARTRTISSTQSVPSTPRTSHPPASAAPSGSVTPRPLKLPEAHSRHSQYRGGGHDRPAVPVPNVSFTTSGLRPLTTSTSSPSIVAPSRSLPRPSSRLPSRSPTSLTPSSAGTLPLPSPITSSASAPDIAPPKPKPRIGSGMVYRTSSYSGFDGGVGGGSNLRVPRTLTLASMGNQPAQSQRSISASLPPRPGMLRTPTNVPRTVAS